MPETQYPHFNLESTSEKPHFLSGIGFLDEEEVKTRVDDLFSQDPALAIKAEAGLLAWTGHKSNHDFTRTRRIYDFEKTLDVELKEKGQINWPVFKLLAEMEEYRASAYEHLELLQILGELPEIFTTEIKAQIEILSECKELKDQVLLHKICDLLEGVLITEQFGDFNDDKKVQARVKEIYDFAKTEAEKLENFLVSTHFKNVVQTYEGRFAQKTDIIEHIPGGSSDYIIASYNEFVLLQSYYASILAGKTSYSAEKPLLPIGQGFLASYDRGKVKEFYKQDPSLLDGAYSLDRQMVSQNSPEDSYIYKQLNGSNPTEQAWVVSGFLRRLQKQDRDFYFNVINTELDDPADPHSGVLNPQTLHAETLANILSHNYRYLVRNTRLLDHVEESISPEEFLKKAFPIGMDNPEKGYLYLYMLGLTARKAIEENLGENLANIPPFGQAALLEFLASRNKKEFERVVKAGDAWGTQDQNPTRQDFLLSFLAVNENSENQEVILSLAEQLPKEVGARLFAKYAEIVMHSQEIQTFVRQELKADADEKTLQKINRSLFKKANGLLATVYESLKKGEKINYADVYQTVEQYRTEVAVLASALKNVKGIKLGDIENSSLEVKDSSRLTDREKREMAYSFKANREKLYPGGLKEHTSEEFEKKLAEPRHQFYIYNFKDHPAVFFHVDRESQNTWYVGSLNLGPEASDSPLAVEVIRSALDQDGGRHNLRAIVYEHNPALKYYTKVLGFKLTGKEEEVIDQAGNSYKYVEVLRPKAA